MKRRLARIKTVQALYQIEMTDISPNHAIESVLEEEEATDTFLESLVYGTVEHLKEIDASLEEALEHWTLPRISRVDRAILRLAVFEMKYVTDIPSTVSLNEAIDLAKGFNVDDEPGKFVNGVLSKIAATIESK